MYKGLGALRVPKSKDSFNKVLDLNQPIKKCQLVPVSKLYKYSDSSNHVQPWVPLRICARL